MNTNDKSLARVFFGESYPSEFQSIVSFIRRVCPLAMGLPWEFSPAEGIHGPSVKVRYGISEIYVTDDGERIWWADEFWNGVGHGPQPDIRDFYCFESGDAGENDGRLLQVLNYALIYHRYPIVDDEETWVRYLSEIAAKWSNQDHLREMNEVLREYGETREIEGAE